MNLKKPWWFAQSKFRKEQRKAQGVTMAEAVSCLKMYTTTIWPIATEMADWICSNWSIKQVNQLPLDARLTLYKITQEKMLPTTDLYWNDR